MPSEYLYTAGISYGTDKKVPWSMLRNVEPLRLFLTKRQSAGIENIVYTWQIRVELKRHEQLRKATHLH